MEKKQGKIIRDPHINVWPHEMHTAEALADAGYTVEFIKRSEEFRQTSADIIMDGIIWEIKAPTADRLKAIERNLKRGRWQSENIIFDSRRMKRLPNEAIEREVCKQADTVPRVARLLYINRHSQVIDIK